MKTLILHLHGTSPRQLPMKRLAQYLSELSNLYGSEEGVSFDSVSPGSAMLNAVVADEVHDNVLNRISLVSSGNKAPQAAQKAYRNLAGLMQNDDISGNVETEAGCKILEFPRVKERHPPITVFKQGSVQGKLYSVGGKDSSIPVRLEGPDGETLNCETDVATASLLGNLLFHHLRLHGKGEWERKESGGWRLKKLFIHSYEELEHTSIKGAIERLRESYQPQAE